MAALLPSGPLLRCQMWPVTFGHAALIEVKKLADKLGGVERALEAVEALPKLL